MLDYVVARIDNYLDKVLNIEYCVWTKDNNLYLQWIDAIPSRRMAKIVDYYLKRYNINNVNVKLYRIISIDVYKQVINIAKHQFNLPIEDTSEINNKLYVLTQCATVDKFVDKVMDNIDLYSVKKTRWYIYKSIQNMIGDKNVCR